MVNCFEVMLTDSKQVLDLAMDSQHALRLGNRRFESSNLALLLTSVLVRNLSSVVLILSAPMLN